jgi:hypothetical protein
MGPNTVICILYTRSTFLFICFLFVFQGAAIPLSFLRLWALACFSSEPQRRSAGEHDSSGRDRVRLASARPVSFPLRLRHLQEALLDPHCPL